MKKTFLSACAVFFMIFLAVVGKVNAQSSTITDEELTKYAVMEDSIDAMKANVNVVINEMIKSNPDVTGQRYLEIAKAGKDEAKLKASKATEKEIAFVNDVQVKKDELTQQINVVFQTLAKDYLGDGGRVYKKVKTTLQSDEEVKTRYEIARKELQGKKVTVEAQSDSVK